MCKKKFILNADDFGMTNAYNRAVLDGYNKGLLLSASVCANGNSFEPAMNEILPECPNLSVGVHLNIIEGKSLLPFTKLSELTNLEGEFNNGFIALLKKSGNNNFLNQVEAEFRCQIERVYEYTKPTHIDSHVHVHAIPNIFKIVAKLAHEYEIPFIRCQNEKFYITPVLFKHLNLKYPPNIIKIYLLKYFTSLNMKEVERYSLRTNNRQIGVGYTGLMDEKTLEYGLKAINNEELTEALIHPCNFEDIKNQHYKEFLITQSQSLKEKIQKMGFEITNYKFLSEILDEKV